jgi:hypothetical protein
MRLFFLTLILVGSLSLPASARMVDHSLSPEESMRVPDTVRSSPNSAIGGIGNGNFSSGNDVQERIRNAMQDTPTGYTADRFMDAYCVQKASAGNNATQQCFETKRNEACTLFKQLPLDAQNVIDAAISCANTPATPDPQTGELPPVGCGTHDTMRLNMLKKYWRDTSSSYAVVFLPDMIANATQGCLRK